MKTHIMQRSEIGSQRSETRPPTSAFRPLTSALLAFLALVATATSAVVLIDSFRFSSVVAPIEPDDIAGLQLWLAADNGPQSGTALTGSNFTVTGTDMNVTSGAFTSELAPGNVVWLPDVAAAYTVASITDDENLVVTVSGTSFSSTALKLTTAMNNGTVYRWADLSGNANDALQATGAAQPVLKTAIVNSEPVVRFDGVDDYMGFTLLSPQSFSVFIVHQTSGDVYLLGGTDPVYADQFLAGISGANKLGYFEGTMPKAESGTLGTARGSWNLVEWTRSGASTTISFYEAGVSRSTGTAGGTSAADIAYIGQIYDAVSLTGDIAEIIIYDSALSTGDRQGIEDYLGTKYGITITH